MVTERHEIAAMIHPLRGTLLDLLVERAATVKELATAVERPPSSVAYHINVLVDAGLVRVVRTRRVRAVTERFYGRTARIFVVGKLRDGDRDPGISPLADAAAEADRAHREDRLRAIVRHSRIPEHRIAEFWESVLATVERFGEIPRDGDTTYGFVVGLYPTEFPTLPPAGQS